MREAPERWIQNGFPVVGPPGLIDSARGRRDARACAGSLASSAVRIHPYGRLTLAGAGRTLVGLRGLSEVHGAGGIAPLDLAIPASRFRAAFRSSLPTPRVANRRS